MALWEVRGREQAVQVEAPNWLVAVANAMKGLGLDPGVMSRMMCDIQPNGVVNIRDPKTGIPLVVRRLDGGAAAGATPAAAPPKPAAAPPAAAGPPRTAPPMAGVPPRPAGAPPFGATGAPPRPAGAPPFGGPPPAAARPPAAGLPPRTAPPAATPPTPAVAPPRAAPPPAAAPPRAAPPPMAAPPGRAAPPPPPPKASPGFGGLPPRAAPATPSSLTPPPGAGRAAHPAPIPSLSGFTYPPRDVVAPPAAVAAPAETPEPFEPPAAPRRPPAAAVPMADATPYGEDDFAGTGSPSLADQGSPAEYVEEFEEEVVEEEVSEPEAPSAPPPSFEMPAPTFADTQPSRTSEEEEDDRKFLEAEYDAAKEYEGGNEPPGDLAEQLFDKGMDIAGAESIEEASDLALKLLREFVPAESGCVLFTDVNDTSLRFLAAHGPTANVVKGMQVPLGHGIAGFCHETGMALVVQDAGKDTRHYRAVDAKTGYHTQSVLAAGLRDVDGTSHGCIELLNPPRRFLPWHLDAARSISVALADFMRMRV